MVREKNGAMADQGEEGGLLAWVWGEVKDLFKRTWTLALVLVLVTIGCAGLYYVGTDHGWGIVATFTEKTEAGAYAGISFLDCLYFSAVTVTTLGYGEYLPLSYGRLVAVLEAVVGVILIGVFVSRLVSKHQEHLTKTVLHGEFNGERRKLRARLTRVIAEFEKTPLVLVKDEPSLALRRASGLVKTLARYWRLEKEDPAFTRLVLAEDGEHLMERVVELLGVIGRGLAGKSCGELNEVDVKRLEGICAGLMVVAGVFKERLNGEGIERGYGRVREAVEGVRMKLEAK
jgi:hypothetical protein